MYLQPDLIEESCRHPEAGGWTLRVLRRILGDLGGVQTVSVTIVCDRNMDEMEWVEAK